MKLYLTPKTLKHIIKFLLLFILFSVLIYYFKFGMIDVNAATYGGTITKPENQYHDLTKSILPFFEFVEDVSDEYANQKFDAFEKNNLYVTYKYTYYYDITKSKVYSLHNLLNSNKFYLNQVKPNYCSEYPNDTYCIYEYDAFTSVNDDGLYYYTEFITIKHTGFRFAKIVTHSFQLPTLAGTFDVPGNAYVEVVDFGFADKKSELQPKIIQEIVDSSEIDYFNPEDLPFEESEEDGFIVGLVKDIISGIKNFTMPIWLKIKIFFAKLFLPEPGTFKEGWLKNFSLFEEQLGILFLPFELIESVLNKYLTLGEGSGIINIPTIKDPIYNQTIIASQNLNLKEIFSTGSLKNIHDIYLIVIDGLIVLSLSSLAWKKFNSIFNHEGGKE